jgi:parvulin-like peptidyl-prolyl isomerase
VRVILCDTPVEAEEVHALLEDGADFETVCREHSKAPDAAEGGKVVTAVYGSYSPDVQRELFSLPVGGITKPILTPYGYHLMKVLKRNEPREPKEPFEEISEETHETLEQEVRAHNEMLLQNKNTERIREEAGVEWYWDNFHIVANAFPPDRSFTNPPNRRDEVYPLLYFDESDMDKPLVSYNDVTITIKDFSDLYDRASFFARPRRELRFGGIRQFLTERIMAVLVPEEMERSKVEEIPEVQAVMRAKREELMVSRLYEDLVNQQTVVTEDMIRDYYREHTDFFKQPEKRRFGVILTGDIETAQKAHEELKNGERFRNVARLYSIDESTRETLGETQLLSKGDQPEMDKVGFAMQNIGEISEPFSTSRGWMILKLTEKSDERTFTLQEANESVRKILKQERNEERLNELLAKWKDELGVVIHRDNLKKAEVEGRTAGAADNVGGKKASG